jgi:hypothetical protein
MRRRVIAAAALALVAGAACDLGVGTGSGAAGHLRVERAAHPPLKLMDEAGRADYCSADSLLTIIAIGYDRAAGLAVRVTLPLRAARTFVVQPQLGGVGTATVAFRLANGSARIGSAGTIRLDRSGAISGDFEFAVPDSAGTLERFKGKLSRIPVRNAPPGACGVA